MSISKEHKDLFEERREAIKSGRKVRFNQDLKCGEKLIVFEIDDRLYYRLYYYEISGVTSGPVGPFTTLNAAVSYAYMCYARYKDPSIPFGQLLDYLSD